MTKDFGPFFLVSSRATNIGEQFLWIHKLFFWRLPWKLYKLFWDHRRLLKTESFEKKRQNFHRKENFGLVFLVLSSMAKAREKFITLHNIIWQNIMQMTWPFLWNLRGGLKQTFQKVAFSRWQKIGPFFLVSSKVTNIGEQFIRIHELFWQLLWNL